MSFHDLKTIKLQVSRILNKLASFIIVANELRYSSADIDTTHPQSLVMRQDIETVRREIRLWDGEPTQEGEYVTHPIGGIEYEFRSLVDDNVSEPSLDNPDWKVIGAPGGGSSSTPTSGTLLSSDSPLVITWDTDLVPDDTEGRTYLEKHGPLEKVSIQVTMPDPTAPDPEDDPLMTVFPSWRFDDNTKNILTIDNQGQKLYYVIGFGADRSSSGGAGITLTTEGTSGAATLEDNVLNIPVYTSGGGDTPDATDTIKGKIQLAGDLSGTAAAPTVPALANKVDKDGSKVLSDNNYDNTDKAKVAATSGTNTGDQDLSNLVVKETGKGLSKNDYTDTDKAKVAATSGTNTGDDSPNTNSNAYADGKVQDSLTASTTIAPSATAVSGALSGKEPSITAGTSAQFWLGNKTWGDILTTVLGVVLTGLSTATSAAVAAADTIIVAIGKLQAQITLRATIASPTFTGTPSLPTGTTGVTQTAGDSSTKLATTAFVTAADALKAAIAAAQVTLTALTFTADSVSGTISSPITGNITGVTTGAQLGVTILVIHNSGTEPTFDSKFKKLSGSGNYVLSQVNYIYCQYIDATHIIYSINQSA